MVNVLKEDYPTLSFDFVIDENNVVNAIYFQDEIMKRDFQKHPEVLLADATHKLNLSHMPLFPLVCIDGEGNSKIVAFFIIQNETADTIRSMIKIFKTHNPSWIHTKVILQKNLFFNNIFKIKVVSKKLLTSLRRKKCMPY